MPETVTYRVYIFFMANPVNIEEEGGCYHVTFKALFDRFILVNVFDILVFLSFCLHYKIKHQVKLYAFSIMSNHVHLLLQNPEDKSLSVKNFIRDVKREYAKYFNIRHGEKGTLFSRSYRKKDIVTEIQFVNNLAYILNNPVKAGMVAFGEYFSFSSTHLLLSKKNRKSKNYLKLNILKQILKLAKKQVYGEGLSEEEMALKGLVPQGFTKFDPAVGQGRKDYKTRGPIKVRFQARSKKDFKSHPHPPIELTDPLPHYLKIHPSTLRRICHQRAESFHAKSFTDLSTFEGRKILYEGQTKTACESFQSDHAQSIPKNATKEHAIVQTPEGTYLVILPLGRPPGQKEAA